MDSNCANSVNYIKYNLCKKNKCLCKKNKCLCKKNKLLNDEINFLKEELKDSSQVANPVIIAEIKNIETLTDVRNVSVSVVIDLETTPSISIPVSLGCYLGEIISQLPNTSLSVEDTINTAFETFFATKNNNLSQLIANDYNIIFIQKIFSKSINIITENITNVSLRNQLLIEYIYQTIIAFDNYLTLESIPPSLINYNITDFSNLQAYITAYLGILQGINNDLRLNVLNMSIYNALCDILNSKLSDLPLTSSKEFLQTQIEDQSKVVYPPGYTYNSGTNLFE